MAYECPDCKRPLKSRANYAMHARVGHLSEAAVTARAAQRRAEFMQRVKAAPAPVSHHANGASASGKPDKPPEPGAHEPCPQCAETRTLAQRAVHDAERERDEAKAKTGRFNTMDEAVRHAETCGDEKCVNKGQLGALKEAVVSAAYRDRAGVRSAAQTLGLIGMPVVLKR